MMSVRKDRKGQKMNNNKQNQLATRQQTTADSPVSNPKNRDSRTFGQYAVDRTFEEMGKGFRRLEAEKPGSCRKLAGISLIGLGTIGIGTGVYLLVI